MNLANTMLFTAAVGLAGCGASWEDAVSPNFEPRETDAADNNSVSLGEVTLVDDGNGTFSRDEPKDIVIDAAGVRVPSLDSPRVLRAFERIGISGPQFQHAPVKELRVYIETLRTEMVNMRKARDGKGVWEGYDTISKAAAAANVPFGADSLLFARSLSFVTGQLGCFIPLYMAEASSARGDVTPMMAEIEAAAKCAKERKIDDKDFPDRIVAARTQGFSKAIATLSARDWTYEDLSLFNQEVKKLADALKKAGGKVEDEFMKELGEMGVASYTKAIENVLTRDEVKAELAVGKADELNAAFSAIKEFASQVQIYDEIKAKFKEEMIKGYRTALEAIKARSGELSDAAVAKERLDALESAAKDKERMIYNDLRKEFLAARKALSKSGKK